MVPNVRIRVVNDAPVRDDRAFVLYWMIAFRRVRDNHGLDRAIEMARALDKPLIVLEPLRVAYQWASDRLHRFVLDGMADQRDALRPTPIRYFPYVEMKPGAGRGLLEALAADACIVVTDDFPCFFLPRMVEAAGRRLDVRLEAIDGNGLYPMRATMRHFTRAHSFRRHLQKTLLPHLAEAPAIDPLSAVGDLRTARLPRAVLRRFPEARSPLLDRGNVQALAQLPIDHSVAPVTERGGAVAAAGHLDRFLKEGLERYSERSHPDARAASGLSPWLHFGHLSTQEVWRRLVVRERWSSKKAQSKPNGSREGFWNMSPAAESFIDEFVTWRELGLNNCVTNAEYDSYESLPEWAKQTLRDHETDPRPVTHTHLELQHAETSDEIWNAAQRQLVRDGRMHNYLRMLWGKKILEWTRSPREALEVMTALNNKYALDGRDPNSYSGIHWVLGRYDRAWGPEREVFGKIRYMSSGNTRRKLRLSAYLKQYGPRD